MPANAATVYIVCILYKTHKRARAIDIETPGRSRPLCALSPLPPLDILSACLSWLAVSRRRHLFNKVSLALPTRPGSNVKSTLSILNCILARQLCFEDASCSAILEIIPRVCGPVPGE